MPQLEAARLLYEMHVFVDTFNAPADAVGGTVLSLAADLRAAAVVVAANDGVADKEVLVSAAPLQPCSAALPDSHVIMFAALLSPLAARFSCQRYHGRSVWFGPDPIPVQSSPAGSAKC